MQFWIVDTVQPVAVIVKLADGLVEHDVIGQTVGV